MTFILSKKVMLVIFIVGLFYSVNFDAFFQQDEWIAFGNALSLGNFSLINLLKFSFAPNVGHYVPFHHLTFGLLFQIIGVDFQKWIFLSILWHLSVTLLVGVLFNRLLQSKNLALVGMLLFGLSASAHQATSWPVADINTHGSTFFGLLSLLCLDSARNTKDSYKRWIAFSVASLIASLMFKETTIAMFVVLPIYTLMFLKPSKNIIQAGIDNSVWLISGILYFGARIWMFLLPSAQESASVVTASQSIQFILYNMITSPAKAFFQGLVPHQLIGYLGSLVGYVPGRLLGYRSDMSEFTRVIQIPILEFLLIILYISVLVLVYRYRKNVSKQSLSLSIFALVFVSANSLIYAFSPERSGVITYIDSRNLYLTLFGSILFVLSLFNGVSYLRTKKAIATLLLVILGTNIYFLFTDFTALQKTGHRRRTILEQVDTHVVEIPSTIIMYVESDASYYGLPAEKPIPPFQSGFGQTLLVYLSQKAHFPAKFYSDYFLWPLGSQGYIDAKGRGYGYFSNYDKLLEAVKLHNISVDNVYGFAWKSGTESILNTTSVTRAKLNTDL